MGIGDGGDKAVRAFDGHIDIGRQARGAMDKGRLEPQLGSGGEERTAHIWGSR